MAPAVDPLAAETQAALRPVMHYLLPSSWFSASRQPVDIGVPVLLATYCGRRVPRTEVKAFMPVEAGVLCEACRVAIGA